MSLPNRYLELKKEEIEELGSSTIFKVKHVNGHHVLISAGETLFCIKTLWNIDIKRGEILHLEGNLLVPKDQPMFV